MNTKIMLPLAIIAALPFTANATQTIVTAQTPAAVGSDGTVSMAATSGPYQTATIGEHDDEHIATTAYVKGAYNDSIRAVNKLDSDKQNQLINMQNNHDISTKVFHADLGGLPNVMQSMNSDEYAAMYADFSRQFSNNESNTALDDALMSAGTILQLMHTTNYDLKGVIQEKQNHLYTGNDGEDEDNWVRSQLVTSVGSVATTGRPQLVTGLAVKNAIDDVNNTIAAKRVKIYTTWDDDRDSATTEVSLITAASQN